VALDGSSTGIKTYGPYGEPLPASAAGDRFRYTGQQMVSELGLYYYKARFYSPTLGRFLQSDPVGYQSDLNLYAYVGNDPVNLTDPTGEFIVGALLGAAIETTLQLNANGADFSNLGLEDLRNINISNVVIAAAVGALAPGYLNVAKTAVTSGKAVNNLLSQVPNANTVDRLTKIGNRIEDNVNKVASAVTTQALFQGAKSLLQAANDASSNSRAAPSSNSYNVPLPISGSSLIISNASLSNSGSSSSNFGLPVKMGPIK
jgi:RHS repeat-associated protein